MLRPLSQIPGSAPVTNRSPDFSRRAFSTVCLELAATIYFLIEMSQAVVIHITHSHGSARVL